jgi:hypothetical protein
MCSIVAAVDFHALGRFGWNWFPDSEIAFKAAISPENLIFFQKFQRRNCLHLVIVSGRN